MGRSGGPPLRRRPRGCSHAGHPVNQVRHTGHGAPDADDAGPD